MATSDSAESTRAAAPLTPGNAVEVLANGDDTFPRLWRDLGAARRSVTAQIYYAGPGAVADTAMQILTDRARAGVDVYFLYDTFGAKDLPQRYLDTLRAAGPDHTFGELLTPNRSGIMARGCCRSRRRCRAWYRNCRC